MVQSGSEVDQQMMQEKQRVGQGLLPCQENLADNTRTCSTDTYTQFAIVVNVRIYSIGMHFKIHDQLGNSMEVSQE